MHGLSDLPQEVQVRRYRNEEGSPNSKKQKAVISAEKCKGCGLCIISCKQNAMRYEIVRPPEYIRGRSTSVSTPGATARTVPVWGHYDLK